MRNNNISPFRTHQQGVSLVEILVAIAIFSTVIYAVISIFVVSEQSVIVGRMKSRGLLLMTEYIEKLKTIRRDNWDALANNSYIIEEISGNVVLTVSVTPETVGDYTRLLLIEDAFRDANGNLVESGGTVDPSTKKVTVTVTWTGVKSGSLTRSLYLTRYLDNLAWIQTTQTEFDNGTHSGTVTLNASGGEVVLGAGGSGDWCDPNLTITGLDLPKNGVAKAVTAIEGQAFAGTGENASGESLVTIDISNTNPPAATILGTMNGFKTNDVFGEQNYGYIATDTNSEEVVIISIASTPYSKVGWFNASGSTDADSVFIAGNTGYVIQGSKLWNFDLTSKTGSRPTVDPDGIAIEGTGTSVVVVGDYAYVTALLSHDQLQIYNVSTPTAITFAASITLPTSQGARDVFVNQTGTRAYVVTNDSSSANEFFVVDITTKSNPLSLVGSYNTDGMNPRAVEVVPGGRAIVVGTGGEEYQVINVSNEAIPVPCGGMDVDSGIYDSASVLEADNDAYTYIVTGDASEEFRMIEGGPGGAYTASGIFESQTFDPGGVNSTGFNRFDVILDTPINTSIRFQVASVDEGSFDCTDADFSSTNFVGPDGSSGSFFLNAGGAIPTDNDGIGYENAAQCFRFRAYLDTADFTQTPTLFEVSVNYSP